MIIFKIDQLILFLSIFSLIISIDANRSRRRRRQIQGNQQQQQIVQNDEKTKENNLRTGKNFFGNRFQQPSRQFSGYGQYGYGNIIGLNYPYGGSGVGSYQYGTYNPYNSMNSLYGSYYNQYPSSNNFYGSNYYNRPGYSNSYYSPYGSGGSYYGGYYYGHSTTIHQRNSFLIVFSLIFIWIYFH